VVLPLSELLRVVEALNAAKVPFWLGGGWGVDALWGAQSRFHGDLDLVLDEFERTVGPVSDILGRLGYRPSPPLEGGVWWLPQTAVFEAPGGYRIEVLGLNWSLLATAASLVNPRRGDETLYAALRASCLATGQLGDWTLPCLSAAAQTLFHTGYHGEATDERELALLATLGKAPRTATVSAAARTSLVVPIFDLDGRTWQVWNEVNSTSTVPPHISLLFPFLPMSAITLETCSRLAGIFASVPPFDYELAGVGWFDKDVAYLRPEPSNPFVAMVDTLTREFGVLPYEGAYAQVVPHLTLGEKRSVRQLRQAAARVQHHLPERCRATDAWLMSERRPDSWEVAARFPLGG
jgi:2'-5' RNA ligase